MKGVVPAPTARRTGRPLSFDRGEALRKAMLLFWSNGYEGTSINDLTDALGITPPSIYAAFGSKKQLFLEAVGLYLTGPSPQEIIDRESNARQAARQLMREAAITFTNPANPRGCLLASSAVACSEDAYDMKDALAKIRLDIEYALKKRILIDVRSGGLPKDTDATTLAALSIAVIQGMSTLARDGAPRSKLLRIVEAAMRSWP